MIRYVDEFIDALQKNNKSNMLEVRICGREAVSSVELNGDYIDVYGVSMLPTDDLEMKITDLEGDVEDLNGELDGCKEALELVCDGIDDLTDNIENYKRFHPEEWKILGQLKPETLEDFVKTVINWYNIERTVRNEC